MLLLHRRIASKQRAAVIADAASLVLVLYGEMKASDDAMMMCAAAVGRNVSFVNWAMAWKSMTIPVRSLDVCSLLNGH